MFTRPSERNGSARRGETDLPSQIDNVALGPFHSITATLGPHYAVFVMFLFIMFFYDSHMGMHGIDTVLVIS